jgi:hypothetical protein
MLFILDVQRDWAEGFFLHCHFVYAFELKAAVPSSAMTWYLYLYLHGYLKITLGIAEAPGPGEEGKRSDDGFSEFLGSVF